MSKKVLSQSLGMQDSSSPSSHLLTELHDHVMLVGIFILAFVIFVTSHSMSLKFFSRIMKSSEVLEIFWTVIPCGVLLVVAIPSLITLYLSEEVVNPLSTVKITGHQWYWSYEYDNSEVELFDSYMIPTTELTLGSLRLLEVDNRLFIPLNTEIRAIITSSDVIHSWSVPSLGVKIDAVPGRLNQASLYASQLGVSYGQCSEICGSMHAFMPISVEVLSLEDFSKFLSK